MRLKALTYTTLLFCLFLNAIAYAQTSFCPPNINFESGNFSNWYLYKGTCCPISTSTLSGAVLNRHTLTSGNGVDQYGGFPVVVPGGGSYSLKLGNDSIGAQAERARYYVHVPSGPGKFILLYRYAVVFEDPGHNTTDQPRFEVTAFDSATNTPIACNQHIYVSSSGLPGFNLSPVSGQANVFYKPWTTASLDLTGYGGKTVAVDFASGDCDLGGHFGYGYVDINCGLFQIYAANCNGSPQITLTGPPGYKSYTWMDSSLTTVIDTQKTVTIQAPSGTSKFAVILVPYPGFGCPDTLFTDYIVIPDTITATASPDTLACHGAPVQLNASTTYTKNPVTYKWWPSAGLSCTSCKNPIAKPSDTTKYFVSVENDFGCRDTADVLVAIPKPIVNAGSDTSVCEGDTVLLSGSGTGPGYQWIPLSASILNPTSPVTQLVVNFGNTYRLVVTDLHGCKDTDAVNIIAMDKPVANAGNDTGVCPGKTVTLTGSGGGAYSWSPAANIVNPTNPAIQVKVTGSASYYLTVTNISGCKDKDTVDVVAYPEPVANAGNDTAVCAESTIQLHGSGGTLYYWTPDAPNMVGSQLPNPTVYLPYQATPKTYRLIVFNTQLCSDTDYVDVSTYPIPTADAGGDIAVCENTFVTLNGSGGGSYYWTPAAGLSNPSTSAPGFYATAGSLYTLEVTNTYGCKDVDDVNVNVYPKPVANAGNDTAICKKTWLQLNGSGGGTYNWSPSTNLSTPGIAKPTHFADTERVYTLIVTSVNGCKDTDEVKIIVNPVPVADAGNDTGVCAGGIVILQGSGGGSYNWSPGTGLSDPNVSNPSTIVNAPAHYLLTVTNSYGCSDTQSVALTAYPYPTADAGNDSVVCPGAYIQLHGRGGGTYSWYPQPDFSDPAEQKPYVTVNASAEYNLVVMNDHGCSDTDNVSFSIIPFHFEAGPGGTICEGDSVQLHAAGGRYLWFTDNAILDDTAAELLVRPLRSQEYFVTITDTLCNREETFSVKVDVHPLPELQIIASPKDCGLESGQLIAYGAESYSWSPRDFLSHPEAAVTAAFPKASTRYTLTGISEYGCKDTASVLLEVYPGDGRIFAPDAFTPNGDGINDCYRVIVPGDITKFELLINNRWGQAVFHTKNPSDCWDGMYKGEKAELDTYFYFYKATSTLCGEIFKKGDIELIR